MGRGLFDGLQRDWSDARYAAAQEELEHGDASDAQFGGEEEEAQVSDRFADSGEASAVGG